MANGNVAFGLKPVRTTHRSQHVCPLREYYVPAGDAVALFIGDPVVLAGSADADATTPSVTRATAAGGNRITGVVQGFRPDVSVVANGYRVASVAGYVLVADDPDTLYEVQANGALAAADVGLNADFVAAAGSTMFRSSGWMLDVSTKAVTATLQARIMGIQPRADNDLTANTKVLVRLNTTTEIGAAGSTGV